jgi:hypothetical protein
MKKKEEEDKNNEVNSQDNRSTIDGVIVTKSLDTDLINTHIEECTPLATIPGILSLTYEGLGFKVQ